MTITHNDVPTDSETDNAIRLLSEGTSPLVSAAREAGLRPVPSHRTLLRAAVAGRLESLLVAGRRVTSPAAVVRWVVTEQHRRIGAADGTEVTRG